MKIDYTKGEMVVTHDSGHVDKYNRLELERLKNSLQEHGTETQNQIALLDEAISNINSSIGAQ